MNNDKTQTRPPEYGGATGSADRICERADRCDKLNSDGERCRHGYPHPWDSGCEMSCRAKLPFGAVCCPLPNDQAHFSEVSDSERRIK